MLRRPYANTFSSSPACPGRAGERDRAPGGSGRGQPCALQEWTRDRVPLQWATTQTNPGVRPGYERYEADLQDPLRALEQQIADLEQQQNVQPTVR